MFRAKAKGMCINGHVVSVDKDKVVIAVENGAACQKGQRVRATVGTMRKTALGRNAKVSEVIAQGTISAVSGRNVTIHSKSSNPIVSQRALRTTSNSDVVVNIKQIK